MEFYYKSSKWKRLAKRAMIRDNYQCQISKRYGKNVPAKVVHHIYPVEHFPEYAYSLWNLICLSEAEHNRVHDRKTGKLTEAGLNLMRRTKIPPHMTARPEGR